MGGRSDGQDKPSNTAPPTKGSPTLSHFFIPKMDYHSTKDQRVKRTEGVRTSKTPDTTNVINFLS